MNLPIITDSADYNRHFNSDIWQQAVAAICARHSIPYETLRRSPVGENIIFFIDERFVIKLYAPFRNQYKRELSALQFAASATLSIQTPDVVYAGELDAWPYIVMTKLNGRSLKDVWSTMSEKEQLYIASQLGEIMRELHSLAVPLSEGALARDWSGFVKQQACDSVERQRACGANPEWLRSLPGFLEARLELLPADFRPVFLHGDVHAGNLLIAEEEGRSRITGIFDFGDSFYGFREYELVAPSVLMVQGRRDLQRAMLLAYGYSESELDARLRARLMLLTVLYECSDLRKYALRLDSQAINLTLAELETAIWTFV